MSTNASQLHHAVRLLNAYDLVHNDYPLVHRHHIDCWALSFNQIDFGRQCFNNGPWMERKANWVHLIEPGTSVVEERDPNLQRVPIMYCIFTTEEPFALRYLLAGEASTRIYDPQKTILPQMRELARICSEHGPNGMFQAHAQFYKILAQLQSAQFDELGEHWTLATDANKSEPSDFVQKIYAYLWPRRYELIRIEDIAAHMYMSVSTLTRRYRRESGESLLQTQSRWRIDEAKELLQHGMAIKEIADRLGYYDMFHFSKAFKKQLGISPRQFRSE